MAAQVTRRLAQFTPQDLIINERSLRTPYRQRTDENKTALHWGQRKLHLSEVEFFAIYWDPTLIPNPICVYAGAAPGTHISLLSVMFPSFTFHLYDPADFDIKENDKIRLFKEYFTDEVAARYSGRNDVLFVSDIRTADYKSLQREALEKRGITKFDDDGAPVGPYDLIKEAFRESEVKNEDQIWGDMIMQQNWVLIMNPEHAFLKFRLPYALDGKDRTVQYLKGIVYWQVWPPQTSTETRLKPVRNTSGVYELGEWHTLEYEQWCFHHNAVDREHTSYANPFTGTNDPIDFPELLNDYDSVAEAIILRLYLEKLGFKGDIYEQVKKLSRLITMAINHYRTDEHGAKTLASKRASPVKSSSKAALDAFRRKRTGRPTAPQTAFQHTKIVINPTWRQQATVATAQPVRTPTVQPLVAPINQPNVPAITPVTTQPARSPQVPITVPPTVTPTVVQPTRTPNVPAITPVTVQPARSPTVQPIVPPIAQPARSPTVQPIVPPIAQPTRSPTVQPIAQPARSPTTQPIVPPIAQPARSPTVQTVVPPIAQPARSPTVQPIVPPIAQPTIQPVLPQATPKTPGITVQPVAQPVIRTPGTIAVPQIQQVPQPTVRTPVAVPQIQQVAQPVVRTPGTVAVPQPTVRTPGTAAVPQVPQPVRTPGATTVPQVPLVAQPTFAAQGTTTVPQVPQIAQPVIRTPGPVAVPQIVQPNTQGMPTILARPNIAVPPTTLVQPIVPPVMPQTIRTAQTVAVPTFNPQVPIVPTIKRT